MKNKSLSVILIVFMLFSSMAVSGASGNNMIGINVLLNTDPTDALLADLGNYGKVRDVLYEVDALTMQIRASDLGSIQALPYVASANPDASRNGAPVDSVAEAT